MNIENAQYNQFYQNLKNLIEKGILDPYVKRRKGGK